jgi:anti-sigma factor ChrR (cupin superfamily)
MARLDTTGADAGGRIAVDTATLPWQPSPATGVWRKRLFHDGPAEHGRVTSLVRFDPGAHFPPHGHPDGESILVLDGIFSDESGGFPAGTWLFNPEGSRHAPFSRGGCLILVRLQQHPGRARARLAVDTDAIPWQPSRAPGIAVRPIGPPDHPLPVALLRFAPGAVAPYRRHARGAMLYVLAGTLSDEAGDHPAGSWLCLAPGAGHTPSSATGCTVFVDADGIALGSG